MDVDQLKQDVREGRVKLDRLVDLIGMLQGQLVNANQQLAEANERIRELEEKLGQSPTTKLDEEFSTKAEEKRQEARGRKPKKKSPSYGGAGV
jgi:chromosome segregation ATPase